MTPSASAATSESLRAGAVSISLTVKDIHASLAWYRDVFGLAVERQTEREGKLRAVRLTSGEVRLNINQDDGAKGWERVKGEGFSLMFTTAQNVDAIAAGIKARGGKLDSEPADMPWGFRLFRLRDPDGYRFSVASPLPA